MRWRHRFGRSVLDGPNVQALFIAPEWIGRGGGRLLIRVMGRSDTDSAGRPYPLLHLSDFSDGLNSTIDAG